MANVKGNLSVSNNTSTQNVSVHVTSVPTYSGNLSLTNLSTSQYIFTGDTTGLEVLLPDATTLEQGHLFVFWNESTKLVCIHSVTDIHLYNLKHKQRVIATLQDNSTSDGVWVFAKLDGQYEVKSGVVLGSLFSGSPKTYPILFDTAFPDSTYSINITGSSDVRTWTYESKTTSGFVINAHANQPLIGEVSWQAITSGEY